MKKVVFAFFSFAALVFAGCKAKGADLLLGDWNLIQYDIDGKPVDFSEASVSFEADGKNIKLSGFSGVNRFSGSCKVDGNNFAVGTDSGADFATTKMAGPKEDMEFERTFLASLSGADSVEVKIENEKQNLCIFNSSEKSKLVFQKASIKDNAWILSSVLQKDAVVSINVDKNEILTLEFTEEGKASGFSGVNYYTMNYTLDENRKKLSFTNGAATLMDSGNPVATELEHQFFMNIVKVKSYSISGENLTLCSKDGKILFEFVKNPTDKE